MNILNFEKKHVKEATALALANYYDEGQFVKELPEACDIPDLNAFAENGLGVAALENGTMIGFLCCYEPFDNIRCKYGKEDMERMEKYTIRCHNCGREIGGEGDFRQCDCGYQYSYKEYRRSFRRNNMPTGAATKVFDEYMRKWNVAKGYSEKMILIDALLYEFHLSLVSGAVHRPVAMNFIDGTRKQIESVIGELAR